MTLDRRRTRPSRARGFDRTPPQAIEAEQSVLGAMMLSKDAIADVVEVLRPATSTGRRTSCLRRHARSLRPGRAGRRRHGLRRAHPRRATGPGRRGAVPAHADLDGAHRGQRRLLRADRRRPRHAAAPGHRRHPHRPDGLRHASGANDVVGSVDDVVDRAQAEIYDVTERRTSEDYVHIESLLQPTWTRSRRSPPPAASAPASRPASAAGRDHQRTAPRADGHRRRPAGLRQVDARAGLRAIRRSEEPQADGRSSPWRWASSK